ncbi:hypothetical protein N1851_026193 [Merluccius polli]|uniref:Uncharacterized protein n=1 Tax=Merluccius polli TaxID=89951 RepID=A0AA47MCL1_MERPO|nr:hypothetical protein N1851_026193 [Merluccius polli]
MLIDAAQQETADSVDVNDPLPSTCDTGTQCNVKPRRSHAVQVNLKPKMVSVRTQTQTSTPLTSPEQTDDEDDPSVISDSSWVPGGHMSEDEEELCEEEPSHTCDPHQNGIDKFIVCQEVLMSLFALCPACCEKSDSLCIMWLPTFLAKPANAPQEHGVSYFGSHNNQGQGGRLHGEEMLVVHVGAAALHELGQAEQVLDVEARGAPAGDDLRGDLAGRGGAQVDGVVRGGDVHQGHQGVVPRLLVPGGELHQLQDVTAAHRLPHVQVLQALLHLRVGHLVGHAPGAGLGREEEEDEDEE